MFELALYGSAGLLFFLFTGILYALGGYLK